MVRGSARGYAAGAQLNADTDAKPAEAVGDWDLRAPDFETVLVSQLTGSIGDAARLVARGSQRDRPWANGFPNFAMYRTFYAGDTHLRMALHDWLAEWGVAFAKDTGLRSGNKAIAGSYAGQDVYFYMATQDWAYSPSAVAKESGIAVSTYSRFRDRALDRVQTSLKEYWMRLQMAMFQVRIMENQEPEPLPIVRLNDGRGFHDVDLSGEGNYRAYPHGSGS